MDTSMCISRGTFHKIKRVYFLHSVDKMMIVDVSMKIYEKSIHVIVIFQGIQIFSQKHSTII